MPKKKVSRIIELNEDLIENNDRLAEQNKKILEEKNVRAFDIVGAIGAGKTAIIENIAKEIAKTYKEKPEFFKYGINPIRIEDDQNEKHKLNKYRANYMIRDVTEDIFLWKQVKEKTNYKILVDPKIQCGHITDIVSDQHLFQSFYQGKMEQLQREKPEEAEKIKEIICRAEPIKSES